MPRLLQRAAKSIKDRVKRHDHPWMFFSMVFACITLIVILVWRVYWHQFEQDKPISFSHYTSIDLAASIVGILIGITLTYISGTKNAKEKEELTDWISRLSKLTPISSGEELLVQINDILWGCTHTRGDYVESIRSRTKDKRPDSKMRNLCVLNPTTSFGYTLMCNVNVLFHCTSDQRSDVATLASIRDRQDEFRHIIENSEKALTASVNNKNVNVRYLSLVPEPRKPGPSSTPSGSETNDDLTTFMSKYVNGVIDARHAVVAAYDSNGGEWDSTAVHSVLTASESKSLYIIDKQWVKKHCPDVWGTQPEEQDHLFAHPDLITSLGKALCNLQREGIERITGKLGSNHIEKKDTHLLPIPDVPIQLFMNYRLSGTTVAEGKCVFFMANRLNMTSSVELFGFTTEDPAMLNSFYRFFDQHWLAAEGHQPIT